MSATPALGTPPQTLIQRPTALWMWLAPYNAQLQWNADGELSYIDTSASGTIVVSTIMVNANLTPSVSNGVISMNMNSVSSSIGGFNLKYE